MPAQTAQQQQPPAIELEVVRPESPHSPGRPLYLNARRFLRICHAIERGGAASVACQRELVSYRNFRRHVTLNPRYARRLREAEEVRDHFLLEFHIANVARHAKENLSASLWWLEHRHPGMFALRAVTRPDPDESPEAEDIPSEVLARHQQLLLEKAREDAQRARSAQVEPAA